MTDDDPNLKTAIRTLAQEADLVPDIGDVERHLTRLRRRRLVGRISVVAAIVVIGLAVLMPLGLLSQLRQNNVALGPSASISTPGTAHYLLGIGFPVCDVSSAHTAFGDAPVDLYVFARGSVGSPCGPVRTGNAYLASYVPGFRVNVARTMGPIGCFGQGCHALGAVRLGRASLLAVVVVNGNAADSVELYRINPGRGRPFTQLTQIVSGKRLPVSFDWGGIGSYRAGATCRRSGLLDVWRATRTQGSWHLTEYLGSVVGARVVQVQTRRSTIESATQLPNGGGRNFCGSPATP